MYLFSFQDILRFLFLTMELVERLHASPVTHASRIRTPLILHGFLREISLFLPSQCERNHVNGDLVELRLKAVCSVRRSQSYMPHMHICD